MIVRIKNLRLRTIIGTNDWERKELQDVIINVDMELYEKKVTETDRIQDTVNYRTITKRIIKEVEQSQFFLLDKLAGHVLQIVMEEKKVKKANVEVDKPNALRFADSVSVCCSAEREK